MRMILFAAVMWATAAAAQPVLDPFWAEPVDADTRTALAALDPESCPDLQDSFEDYHLSDNWTPRFIRPPERFQVQPDVAAEGERAVAITLLGEDLLWKKSKYKHELRVANEARCRFGREVWYSFSFRIEGDYPRTGSTRWVIGQWKEESGASPFLAQRFDNGVFHITVQSNDQREIIAAAPGDYDAKYPFLSQGFRDSEKTAMIEGEPREAFLARAASYGSAAFDLERFGRSIVEQRLDDFPFIADRGDYRKIDGIEVSPATDPILPNPQDGWVHMRYKVKGSRDGNGEISVWANGRHVVDVRGKIGNDVFDGPTKYFKFGHYRDTEPDFRQSTIYFDDFKRSLRRDGVD